MRFTAFRGPRYRAPEGEEPRLFQCGGPRSGARLVQNDLQSFIEAITTFDSAAVKRELSAEDDEKVQVEFFVLMGERRKA